MIANAYESHPIRVHLAWSDCTLFSIQILLISVDTVKDRQMGEQADGQTDRQGANVTNEHHC